MEITLDTDEVLTLLTGSREGARHLPDPSLLLHCVEQVERKVLEVVDAGLPHPASPRVDQLAEQVLGAFDAAPQQTATELAVFAGLSQQEVAIGLARLESTGKVWPQQDGEATVWGRR
jgi:hypothetical protein